MHDLKNLRDPDEIIFPPTAAELDKKALTAVRGLRKAIDARPRHILVQFLLGALVLTFAGGLAGMAVTVLLTWTIPPMPLYDEFYKTADREGAIFVILSLGGIVSGFFPALKASRLNPIEGLRYE